MSQKETYTEMANCSRCGRAFITTSKTATLCAGCRQYINRFGITRAVKRQPLPQIKGITTRKT